MAASSKTIAAIITSFGVIGNNVTADIAAIACLSHNLCNCQHFTPNLLLVATDVFAQSTHHSRFAHSGFVQRSTTRNLRSPWQHPKNSTQVQALVQVLVQALVQVLVQV